MIETKKQRPRVGDTAWFVEWVYQLTFDENGDADRDMDLTHCRRVKTREEAEALAKKVWPESQNGYGVVTYHPAEFVAYDEDDAVTHPHVGFWEDTGDAEVYEGPDDSA